MSADLDREMAYTDWRSSCRSPHPDDDAIVCRRAPHAPGDDHAAGFGDVRVFWPNVDDPRPEFATEPIARRTS